MLTVPEIIRIAKITEYKLGAKVMQSEWNNARMDKDLPLLIFNTRKSVEWAYEMDDNYSGLKKAANYLYTLCGETGLLARAVDQNSAGVVSVGVSDGSATGFPILKVSADFESDGVSVNDTRFVGKNLMVIIKEIPTFLLSGSGFIYTSTGIQIKTGAGATIEDFDASVNDYTLLVHRLY